MEGAALALEQEELNKVIKVLQKQHISRLTRRKKLARMAQIHPLPFLPPSLKRAAASTEDPVPLPLQWLERKVLLYPQQGFDLWVVMGRAESYRWVGRPCGEAEYPRAADEYAAACGLSAAPGFLLFVGASIKEGIREGIFERRERRVAGGEHTAYRFGNFWQEEIAPFGAAERFFKVMSKL